MNRKRGVSTIENHSGIKGNWWFVFLIGLAVGPMYGFRCRCIASEGKIREVYTVAWILLPEGRQGPTKDVFSPLHPRFDLVVEHENLPPETELRASWYHLDKEGEGSSKRKLFHVRPQVVEGSGATFFSAPSRSGTWPGCEYEVIIERNGKNVEKARFRVFTEEKIRMSLYKGKKPAPDHPDESDSQKIFSAKDGAVGLLVEAANPEPGATLRIVWRRKRGDQDFSFYSESDEILLRSSQRLYFVMPKVKKGYCKGVYRVAALLGDKTAAKKDFRITD